MSGLEADVFDRQLQVGMRGWLGGWVGVQSVHSNPN